MDLISGNKHHESQDRVSEKKLLHRERALAICKGLSSSLRVITDHHMHVRSVPEAGERITRRKHAENPQISHTLEELVFQQAQ